MGRAAILGLDILDNLGNLDDLGNPGNPASPALVEVRLRDTVKRFQGGDRERHVSGSALWTALAASGY